MTPPPRTKEWGAHSPVAKGVGEFQFRQLVKKLSTLPTLWSSPFFWVIQGFGLGQRFFAKTCRNEYCLGQLVVNLLPGAYPTETEFDICAVQAEITGKPQTVSLFLIFVGEATSMVCE